MKSAKYIFAAALAVLAMGCNKEQVVVDGTPDGQEVAVTFTTEIPGVIATKSISDGKTAKNLAVAVYEDNAGAPAKYLDALDQNKTFDASLKTTVTFNLVKGKTYHFIFWAQATDAPYDFDKEGKQIKISYPDGMLSNDENRDAFYATATVTVAGSSSETVKLHRPFAQVNFGTADFDEAKAAGFEPTLSTFTISEAAESFLPFTKTGVGEKEVTFADAAFPTEPLTVGGKDYKWLAMNYFIPTGDDQQHTSTVVKASFKACDNDANPVTISYPNAPVRANYRTNILGNLLTSQTVFNVEIVPAFEDEINVVASAADLNFLFTNGGTAKLTTDLTLEETVSVPAGKDVVLDLDGHTLNNAEDLWDKTPNSWSLLSVKGGTLTVKGAGTLTAKENDCYAVDVQDGGHVIIEDGEYVGNIHAVYVEEGTAEIRGGKYSVQQKYPDASKADEFVLNCYDANRAKGTAKIIVTGGEFQNFNPADCQAEGAHTNFVASGYTVTGPDVDGWYKVVAE